MFTGYIACIIVHCSIVQCNVDCKLKYIAVNCRVERALPDRGIRLLAPLSRCWVGHRALQWSNIRLHAALVLAPLSWSHCTLGYLLHCHRLSPVGHWTEADTKLQCTEIYFPLSHFTILDDFSALHCIRYKAQYTIKGCLHHWCQSSLFPLASHLVCTELCRTVTFHLSPGFTALHTLEIISFLVFP